MASQHAEVAIRKHISKKSDEYYGDTAEFGRLAWENFGKNRTQIRNLENIANSSTAMADVLDFIKKQTGKSDKWRRQDFGRKLLERIREPLLGDANAIIQLVKESVNTHGIETDDLRRTHILLCREFIRHLSAHYSYTIGMSSRKSRGKHNG